MSSSGLSPRSRQIRLPPLKQSAGTNDIWDWSVRTPANAEDNWGLQTHVPPESSICNSRQVDSEEPLSGRRSHIPSPSSQTQDSHQSSFRISTRGLPLNGTPNHDSRNRFRALLPLSTRYDTRVDDRRRSSLAWPTSGVLEATNAFDSLDALELIAAFNRAVKRLSMGSPHLTPCARALATKLQESRPQDSDFSTLRSLDRLAVLKEDPKLPILIFREVDAYLSQRPSILIAFARGYFNLPSYAMGGDRHARNPSLERVAVSLSRWCSSSEFTPDTFAARFKEAVDASPTISLPLRLPQPQSALLIEAPLVNVTEGNRETNRRPGKQLYCLMTPQYLDTLLRSLESSNCMEQIELRDWSGETRPNAFVLMNTAAEQAQDEETRLLSCLMDLLLLPQHGQQSPPSDCCETPEKPLPTVPPRAACGWPDHTGEISSDECQDVYPIRSQTHAFWTPTSVQPTHSEPYRQREGAHTLLFPAKSLGQV